MSVVDTKPAWIPSSRTTSFDVIASLMAELISDKIHETADFIFLMKFKINSNGIQALIEFLVSSSISVKFKIVLHPSFGVALSR